MPWPFHGSSQESSQILNVQQKNGGTSDLSTATPKPAADAESAAPAPKPEPFVGRPHCDYSAIVIVYTPTRMTYGRRTGRSLKALENLEGGSAEPEAPRPAPPREERSDRV